MYSETRGRGGFYKLDVRVVAHGRVDDGDGSAGSEEARRGGDGVGFCSSWRGSGRLRRTKWWSASSGWRAPLRGVPADVVDERDGDRALEGKRARLGGGQRRR